MFKLFRAPLADLPRHILPRDVSHGAFHGAGVPRAGAVLCGGRLCRTRRLHLRGPRAQPRQRPLRDGVRDGLSGLPHLACVDAGAALFGGVRHPVRHLPARGRGHLRLLVRQHDRRQENCAPPISPKKTVAGFVGGLFGGMLVAVIMFLLFEQFALFPRVGLRPLHGRDVEAPPSSISPSVSWAHLRDSWATSPPPVLKRALGIKDFGKIFPGHGGIMDRFDSIMAGDHRACSCPSRSCTGRRDARTLSRRRTQHQRHPTRRTRGRDTKTTPHTAAPHFGMRPVPGEI